MQLKYQLFEKNHRRDDLVRKADEEFHVLLSEYVAEEEIAEAQSKLVEVRGRLEKLGEVNPLSLQAYEEEKKRLDEFLNQRDDIITAKQNLLKSIEELDQRARDRFNEIFQEVRQQFNYVFTNFLEDGQADLMLTDPENPLASKVEIVVRMMGRRLKTINQLSGGQKTLLAISLLLAFYLVKPAPFCILDEIDAPLDDINVVRFNKFLRELSQRTQVVIITHNRATMEYADYLYGLTMEKPRESKVISAKLADLEKISTLEDGS
jgi:chromosome segregation protein